MKHSKAIARGSSLSVSMIWENVGVAPPYRDYLLAVRLTNASSKETIVLTNETSIKGWLPGKISITESLELPEDIKPGLYELALAIIDPVTRKPAVRLAITGRAEDGWYPLSKVDIAE